MIEFVITAQGYKTLPISTLSSEIRCEYCGSEGYHFREGDKYGWFCGSVCEPSKASMAVKATMPQAPTKRAILWPKFCEIWGVGDMLHDIRFEKINQTPEKLKILKDFAEKPAGILLMYGPGGLGKTYASLGCCEFFTRTNADAIFITQTAFVKRWLDDNPFDSFVEKATRTALLVIDDFGTKEPPPGFMTFFMDLINSRLQWSNRGTIISTNLDVETFSGYCGESLTDRFKRAVYLRFTGTSRR